MYRRRDGDFNGRPSFDEMLTVAEKYGVIPAA
jgi:hypothetical protein